MPYLISIKEEIDNRRDRQGRRMMWKNRSRVASNDKILISEYAGSGIRKGLPRSIEAFRSYVLLCFLLVTEHNNAIWRLWTFLLCVRVFVRVCVWMSECVLVSRACVFVFTKHCELDLGSLKDPSVTRSTTHAEKQKRLRIM